MRWLDGVHLWALSDGAHHTFVSLVALVAHLNNQNFESEESPLNTALLMLAQASPATVSWSPKVALVMISCNLFMVAIGRYAIRNAGAGPKLPFSLPLVFDGFGVPELLATTSLGHIIGAGMILGMANAGLL